MRRLAAMGAVGALAVASLVLGSDPHPVDPGLAMEPAPSQVAVCPIQVERGGGGAVAIASARPGDVAITAFAGGRATAATRATVDGSGGAAVGFEDLVAGGMVGALVELGTASARAAVVERTLGLASAGCTAPGRSTLVAPGVSTRSGEQLDLVLINPHAVDAVVGVVSSSEEGLDSASELADVIVPAGSLLVRDLASLLPLRQSLSFSVQVERGSVHAFLSEAGEGDSMLIEAVPAAVEWWIPIPRIEGADGRLVISNPSPVEVEAEMDVFAGGAALITARTVTIPAHSHTEVLLEEIGEETEGVRLSATSPVVTSIVFTGPGIRAGSPGSPQAAAGWLVPGPTLAGEARLWILNPSDVDAEVVTQPLHPGASAPTTVVPAGSVRGVAVEGEGAGYLLRSSVDVAVLWTGIDQGVALAGAVPVDE